jgi:uncharacterized membrane protein YoaK (UPF0700 family)
LLSGWRPRQVAERHRPGAFGFSLTHDRQHLTVIQRSFSTDLSDMIFFGSIILSFVAGAIIARTIVIWELSITSGWFLPDPFCRGDITDRRFLLRNVFPCAHQQSRDYSFLCFLMGIHNSTSTQLSGGRVRSTHITGTLTDAGISLASVMVAMLRGITPKIRRRKSQLKTHLTTLFSFITGGIAGLLLFRWIGFNAMLALGVMLAVVATVSIITVSSRVDGFAPL